MSIRRHTYLNVSDPEDSLGTLDSLLHTVVGTGASIQPAEVRHRFVNATFAHIRIECREASQVGELLTFILEVVTHGESVDDDCRILALFHHLTKLAHDLFLELRIIRP